MAILMVFHGFTESWKLYLVIIDMFQVSVMKKCSHVCRTKILYFLAKRKRSNQTINYLGTQIKYDNLSYELSINRITIQ